MIEHESTRAREVKSTPSLFGPNCLAPALGPRAWTPALPSIRNQELHSGRANDALYTDQLVQTSPHHPIPR